MTESPIRRVRATSLLSLLFLFGLAHAQVPVSVTTFHNDNSRTGQNTQETVLTPSNVNSLHFGKLFSVPVDGDVYAQPLYLANVTIAGGTYNVVYVATENDSVYAIDANSGTIYAQVSLIPAGGATVSGPTDLGCSDVIPELGITGTPVIDPTTGTLYVVAVGKTAAGTFVQYLHALDVATLGEKFGGPMPITASVAGTATDGNGSTVTFNPQLAFPRPALMLENSHVIIGWGSHCDLTPWHGWVMSYSASTLAQEAAWNVTPNGTGGGLWMGGGGLAADTSGNIYFPTGNGDWNGTTDFGDSIIKLGPPASGTFPVLDYFTPWNQATLQSGNSDVAAGAVVLLPPLTSGEQLLAQDGKNGTIEILNVNNLGKYCPNLNPACTNSDPNAEQEIQGAGGGVVGSPAYWNGNIYWSPASNGIRAYSFNLTSGQISTTPTSQSAQVFSFAAPTPAISANGTTNAILWALDGTASNSTCSAGNHCLGLYAYDATNLANVLYNSMQSAGDSPGTTVKFAAPVIANGMVYIGTQAGLSAYGLIDHTPTAVTPSFSPAAGTYTSAQTVTLSDTSPGATIYYTLNGAPPTTNSAVYSTPLSISSTTTINAIAVANGYTNSAVGSATYTIAVAGTPVSVSLTNSDNVYGIANTGSSVPGGGLDGAGYAYAESLLGTSISWNGSTFTFGAAEVADAVSSTSITLPAGNYLSLNMLGTAIGGNQPNQTFTVTYSDGTTSTYTQSMSDWSNSSYSGYTGETIVSTMPYRITPTGGESTGGWNLYGYSFALNSAKTVASITLPNNRDVVVFAVDLIPVGNGGSIAATPTFNPPAGVYSSAQSVSLLDGTSGATIYYTTNNTTPTTGSSVYNSSTPIPISSTTTIQAMAVASGYTNSPVASATYTIAVAGSPVSVSMTGQVNVYGIANTGSAVTNGGLDGGDYAYAAAQLGTSITWNSATFTLGAPGVPDAAESTTITLPAGSFGSINLLATAAGGGNQTNQPFIVTYSDGSTSTFSQSLSDWFTPQGYGGESVVSTMAYRIGPSGATSPGPCYLYGYTFTLNSAKTVTSITLPNNRYVNVFALDLIPAAAPSAATPTFNPPAGVYSSAQSVSLLDGTSGATIYYTTNGSMPNTGSSVYNSSTPIPVSATTTINAIAVASGYSNSPVGSATYTIAAAGSPVSVSLSSADNVDGIANTGSAVTGGGLDGGDYAYAAALLGTSITWNSSTFTLGAAGVADAASGTTITLPAGSFGSINLLATAAGGGNQTNQSFIVTYSDGTTSSFTQSMSDWFTPQGYTGETAVSTMAYRISPTGATSPGPCYLYGYTFTLNSAKTVASITLPNNRIVTVLAIDLLP